MSPLRLNSTFHQKRKFPRKMDFLHLEFLESFLNQHATQFSALEVDADNNFSFVKNDTSHRSYAHSDYLLSYTSSFPSQYPPAIMTNHSRSS